MHLGDVRVVSLDGVTEVVATIDDRPSGLGFLPDGTPLVVSADRRHVLRIAGGTTSTHADLTSSAATWLNDMVVDAAGRAWVDGLRHHEDPGGDAPVDQILVVEPDGSWQVAAERALRPNGILLAEAGRLLIHASTRRRKLIGWTVGDDGRLSDSFVWAETGRWTPDGICLDAAGGVWAGALAKRHFVRIERGGEVTDAIAVGDRWAIACALGGPDGRTLFMTTQDRETGEGFVEIANVDVPAAAPA
jgi:sugar lactone lactonase YvrE